MTTVEFGKGIDGKLCIALGYFDGVHAGHRKILEKVTERADSEGLARCVSTFADKPNKSESLMSYYDRKRMFERLGMEYCITMYYLSENGKTGLQFFNELTERYDVGELVCGTDYKFGCDMCGVSELTDMCYSKGIKLNVVPIFVYHGIAVSSTAIKALLKSGKLATANKLLVTPYHISGRIVSGRGVGKHIGVPTVNIKQPPDMIKLRSGVYGTKTLLNGVEYNSVTNYGGQPTFGTNNHVIETNILGYDGDSLLSEDITVYFVKFLRSVMKFKSADDLVTQVKKDMGWMNNDENRTKR